MIFSKEKFYLSIAILIFILVGTISFYFLYSLPKHQTRMAEIEAEGNLIEFNKIEAEKKALSEAKNLLDECLDETEYMYDEKQKFIWSEMDKNECKNNLACMTAWSGKGEEIRVDYQRDRDECFKKYR